MNLLTEENFDETIKNATKPVLVDFFAEWCPPCKMIAPILEEISNETTDFEIYKVNTDENPLIASKFQITNIPTLISFKNGEVYKKNVGALQKDEILNLLS